MNERQVEAQLINALADGRVHSAQQLAERLSMSNGSISQRVQSLAGLGLDVQDVSGGGYRLGAALELLNADSIRQQLNPDAAARVTSLDVYLNTDSTNERLLSNAPPPGGTVQACLAEYQSMGRGRLRRRWQAPFGSGICMSLARQFDAPGAALSSLALAAGVTVIEVLARCGVRDATLKWPNDVIWQGRKLGGILIETGGQAGGPCRVVIGLGLNYALKEPARRNIAASGALAPADVLEAAVGEPPGRNALAASLLGNLMEMCNVFEQQGFAAFAERWRAADALLGRAVVVTTGAVEVAGIARGIDSDGALLVDSEGTRLRCHSGEASLASMGRP